MLTTLADLKRVLHVGTQIRQIWNSREGDVDYVYRVVKVQTHEVATTRPEIPGQLYWISFPNRASIVFTENGWIKMKGDKKMAEYIWVDQEGV